MLVSRISGSPTSRRVRLLRSAMKHILHSSYNTITYNEDKVFEDTDLRNNIRQVESPEEGNKLLLMLITARKRKA